jgi:glycerophosphoryl diester phosphodiesterase
VSRHWRTLDGTRPRIIAHRGASGPLPEHSLAAYELALVQRADVIEPDLVMSSDQALMVRHDLTLARSTDIASRPEYAQRAHDGDWLLHEFDARTLQSLRAIQPFAQRDRSHDGR